MTAQCATSFWKISRPGLRRVRREDVAIVRLAVLDGVNVCLECWKNWMLGDDRDLSAVRMKLVGGDDESSDGLAVAYESNPYEDQRRADNKIGEATGVMIDGLKPAWRWAIHKKCSINTVWQYPRADFLSTLAEAEMELERQLRKNIATATQF